MADYRSEGSILSANTTSIGSASTFSGRPVMQRIRRIGVGSAFKIGAVLSALLFAVFGIFFLVLPGLFGATIFGAFFGRQGGAGVLVASLIGYVLGTVCYGLIGGVFMALYAWLYNLVAGWVGGLRIEMD